MTTTTTFQGMEAGAKSSSRVLRPPGGASNISFGADDDAPSQRKNKMASNIFAGPDDPHAHRRGNPPTGLPSGTLCGEPSAPLRRVQQPMLFPKNNEPELTTIHNSGPALIWNQRQQEVQQQSENGQANDDSKVEAEEVEAEQEEQKETPPEPSAPSGAANVATTAGSRRNPPGGKSSLILG